MVAYVVTSKGQFTNNSELILNAALERVKANGGNAVVHFHGGLMDKEDGLTNAEDVYSFIFQSLESQYEPIFYIWQSLFGDAFKDISAFLVSLDQDRTFGTTREAMARWTAKNIRNGTSSLPNAESVVVKDAEQFLKDDMEFSSFAKTMELGLRGNDPSIVRLDRSIRARLASDKANAASSYTWLVAKIIWQVFKRFVVNKRDHEGATIVEEILRGLYADKIGKELWRVMKRDAEAHFNGAATPSAGDSLLHGLNRIGAKRLVVVAHSAGALLALHLVQKAKQILAPTCQLDVFLMAAALRMDFAAKSLERLPAHARLRSLVMNDPNEKADKLDGNAPGHVFQRSMLYFVSGVIEDRQEKSEADAAILGMERHISANLLPDKLLSKSENRSRSRVLKILQAKGAVNVVNSVTQHTWFENNSEVHQMIFDFILKPSTLAAEGDGEGGIDIGYGCA